MENEVLVEVQNVSKRFCKDLKRSIRYGFMDSLRALSGKDLDSTSLRKDEFWAVRDISFTLRRGDCLGLIGHNGAGKSTLLKILNGLISPDHGKMVIRGKIGALIELGAGFNPILTGRENIYNNAAVLGFSKEETNKKFEDIVAFSEVGEFLDMPVQNYSSGMKVRLGFAVAAQMEPDVLLIDEVLAVGDIGFRMKCLTRIGELLKSTAVIFVSHGMPQVARVANKILLMERGQTIVYDKDVSVGIEKYYESFTNSDLVLGGNGQVEIVAFKILNTNGEIIQVNNSNTILTFYQNYKLILTLDVKENVNSYEIHYSFIDKDTKIVATIYSYLSNKPFITKGIIDVEVLIDKISLGQGIYTIGVAINEVKEDGSNGELYCYKSNVSAVQVIGVKAGVAPIQFVGKWNIKEL